MKDLEIKRSGLVSSIEAILEKTKAEKRGFNAEEKQKIEEYKKEIAGLDEVLAVEKEIRSQAANHFASKNEKRESEVNVGQMIGRFFNGDNLTQKERELFEEGREEAKQAGHSLRKGELYLPAAFFRSNTTATFSDLVKTNQSDALSMVKGPILYNQIATVWENLPAGNFDLGSMTEVSASFQASEDQAGSDISLSPSKASLTPRFLPATASFTRQILNSTSPAIANQIMASFNFAIDKAIDVELFSVLNALDATFSGNCDTYAKILKLQSSINAVPTAFLASLKGKSYWQSKVMNAAGTDSGFVWRPDNTVAGTAAYASPYAPSSLVVMGDIKSAAHVGFWGGAIIIEDVYSNKRAGVVDLQVARIADVKIGNKDFLAVSKSGSYL